MDIRRAIGYALFFVSTAFAQNEADRFSTDLRAKYGPPLHREIFSARGIEMTVDYAANGHVCRIQLPPRGPSPENSKVISRHGVDALLAELLPVQMRGKQLQSFVQVSGINRVLIDQYENVTISDAMLGDKRTGVTVVFVKETCDAPKP